MKINIFRDKRVFLILLLQLIFFSSMALILINFGPNIITSASEIVQETENINLDGQNLEELVSSFDPDKITQLYDEMIKFMIISLASFILLYLVLNSLSWYLSYKILNKNTKGFFKKYLFSLIIHILPIFIFALFLFNSEYDKNSMIAFATLSVLSLFFMYLGQSNLKSFYGKLDKKTFTLFWVWLIVSFVIFWQLYYFQNFVSIIVIILIQTWMRELFLLHRSLTP